MQERLVEADHSTLKSMGAQVCPALDQQFRAHKRPVESSSRMDEKVDGMTPARLVSPASLPVRSLATPYGVSRLQPRLRDVELILAERAVVAPA